MKTKARKITKMKQINNNEGERFELDKEKEKKNNEIILITTKRGDRQRCKKKRENKDGGTRA